MGSIGSCIGHGLEWGTRNGGRGMGGRRMGSLRRLSFPLDAIYARKSVANARKRAALYTSREIEPTFGGGLYDAIHTAVAC